MTLRRSLPALCALAFALPAAACGGEADAASAWAGTIDTLANGRVQVSNPERGAWKEGEGWTLVEEVRIGSADAEGPDLFGRVADVEVDGMGRMWVADVQAQEIRVFGADGGHVRTVGRKGGGPGEFSQMGGIERAPDGRMWVYDPGNTRFSVIDTSGAFVTSHRRDQGFFMMPWNGGFDAQGRFYDVGASFGRDGMTPKLYRHDPATMQPADSFPIPKYDTPRFKIETATMQAFYTVPFAPRLSWTRSRDGGLWIGTSERYAFHKVSFEGDTTRTVLREFTPVPVSAEDRREALEGLQGFVDQGGKIDAGRIPSTKPAFGEMLEADDGHLWVMAAQPSDAPPAWDVFDPEGRYLGRVALPADVPEAELFEVRDGFAYARVEDEDEVSYVVRYRIDGRE